MYIFGESCSSCYTEHKKIIFAIFGFFCDFIRILQVAAKSTQRVRNLFACKPLDSCPPSQIYPQIAQNTLEDSGASQCGPRAKGRRGRPKSGEAGGGDGRGSAWAGSRVRLGPVCVLVSHPEISNFRMWIERIIKQEFSHNFKNFLNIYFVYRKSSIGKKSLFDFLNKNKLVRCECCIHADASWCFLSVKGSKSAIRSCPNPSENFPDFSEIYSHFP
jgi:hypothetical protein